MRRMPTGAPGTSRRRRSGPTASVADELERSAERAGRRGGHGAAMAALERAADLSVDDEDRARRLAVGADAAWRAGLPERAVALLERASPDRAGRLTSAPSWTTCTG